MVHAGGADLEARRLQPPDGLGRLLGGGDVYIADRPPGEGIAHGAADEAAIAQRLYDARDIRVAHPFRRRGETAQSATLPGTSSPSTTLGGL